MANFLRAKPSYGFILIAVLFSPMAIAETNIDGTWEMQVTDDWSGCFNLPDLSGIPGFTGVFSNTYNASIITANNGQVSVSAANTQLTGLINGNTLSLTYTYSQGGVIGNFFETLVINNGSLSGNGKWIWSVGDFSCSVITTTSGKQLSSTNTNTTPPSKPNLQPTLLISSGSFVEPNDAPTEATPFIVNDKPLYQLFDNAGDEDWLEFYAKAGLSYTIDIPAASVGKLINPALTLYDAAGNILVNQVNSGAFGQGEQLRWTAPASGLIRVRVTDQPPLIKNAATEAIDYTYQIRIFLTDAPQQGIIKGRVLENCDHQGLGEVEVSAWLNHGLTDSTLTYKTGEFGLPLNPDNYDLKGLAANYQEASKPVTVSQEDITQVELDLSPTATCAGVKQQLDPVIQAQQASVVYDDRQGILTLRDLVLNNEVFYAELANIGDYHFQLYRFLPIPGVIHVNAPEYSYSTSIAKLPRVFAFNKTWKIQLKQVSAGVLTIEKVEPY